jgi:hypothetical protein
LLGADNWPGKHVFNERSHAFSKDHHDLGAGRYGP